MSKLKDQETQVKGQKRNPPRSVSPQGDDFAIAVVLAMGV